VTFIKYRNIVTNFFRIILFAILIATMIGIWSCAAVQAPPGGKVDKEPPELLSVDPPNRTTQFNQKSSWIIFNEYLDENSIDDAYDVYPTLPEPLEVQFKGEKLKFIWPDDLSPDRTYILNISRNLKDEHGVALSKPIQIAYGTGSLIDNGSIKGKVYGGQKISLLLWQMSGKSFSDSIVFQTPDFMSEVSDQGEFEFNFLADDEYRLMAFDGFLPSQTSDLSRLTYGVPYISNIVIDEMIIDTNVDIIITPKEEDLKVLRMEPGGSTWGKIIFNKNLTQENIELLNIRIDNLDDQIINTFISGNDSTNLVFIFENDSLQGQDSLFIGYEDSNYQNLASFLLGDNFIDDTLNAEFIAPGKIFVLDINESRTAAVNIVLDIPVDDSLSSRYDWHLFKNDSVLTASNWELKNPIWMQVIAVDPYDIEESYKLLGIYEKDDNQFDTTTFYFRTSAIIGRGVLEGTIGASEKNNLIVEIKNTENSEKVYRNFVNSASHFQIENIYEGKYTLMLFEDRDDNRHYTNGSAYPFMPGEWFYMHPDTIEIRGNWTVQADIE